MKAVTITSTILLLFNMNSICSLSFKSFYRFSSISRTGTTHLQPRQILSTLYSTTDTTASDGTIPNANIKPPKQQNNSRGKKVTAANNSTAAPEEAVGPTQEEIRKVRINKLMTLKSLGIEPFAYSYQISHKSVELLKQYEYLTSGEEDSKGDVVSIAGRIMVRRVFGKLAFFTIQDDIGEIQAYIEKGI